jgi:hypothetical protein
MLMILVEADICSMFCVAAGRSIVVKDPEFVSTITGNVCCTEKQFDSLSAQVQQVGYLILNLTLYTCKFLGFFSLLIIYGHQIMNIGLWVGSNYLRF